MDARSRGNGTNFDWLRKSCDISTCDLSPDGNPEKYGRPMKSAIPKSRDFWKIAVRDISSASSLRILAAIMSGPQDLFWLILLRSFATPFSVAMKSGIGW